jgi:thiol-disulfide isomerase/thioredoxin
MNDECSRPRLGGFIFCFLLLSATVGSESIAQSIPEGTLLWKNGDKMQGEWLGVEDGWLSWQAADLEEPVRLWLPRLYGWEGTQLKKETVREVGTQPWSVRMSDGSVVSATELKSADAQALTFESAQLGAVTVKWSGVAGVLRCGRSGPLRYAGPFGLHELSQKTGGNRGQSWEASEHGALETRSIGQAISLPGSLPLQTRLDFHLGAGENPPAFQCRLQRGSAVVEIDTWEKVLVGRSGPHFTRLATAEKTGTKLIICVNWAGRKACAYDETGKMLGEWEVEKAGTSAKGTSRRLSLTGLAERVLSRGLHNAGAESFSDGVTFVNQGPMLRIEKWMLREWDQGKPRTVREGKRAVELLNGTLVDGEVQGLKDGRLFVGKARQPVPLDQVAWIHGGQSTTSNEDGTSDEGWRIVLRDGGILKGQIANSTGREVALTNELCPEVVKVDPLDMAKMRWVARNPFDGPPAASLEHWDEWRTGKTGKSFHGQWVPSSGNVPSWRPDGAAQGVPIKIAADWSLSRRPGVASRIDSLPALAHLETEEMIPVHFDRWSGEKIEVLTPPAAGPGSQIPMEKIRVLELSGRSLDPIGFGDSGWTVLSEGLGVTFDDDRRKLTLPPGGTIGHASLLQGTRLKLTAGSKEAYSALRLRLFCDGTSATSPHVSLLVSRNYGTIYAGLELAENPGDMIQAFNLQAESDKTAAAIELNWSPKELTVRINGALALKHALTDKNRSGSGLILESAKVWGNDATQKTLSDLEAIGIAGARARPAVEAEAKAWALQVPRRLQDMEPQHLLLASNGDLLRGTVESLFGGSFTLRSGMEKVRVPADRVAVLIRPTKATTEGKNSVEPLERPGAPVWISTVDGMLLNLVVQRYGPEWIEGESPHLGMCKIPVALVSHCGSRPPDGVRPLYRNWQLTLAPQPQISGHAGVVSPLVGKAAPELKLDLVGGGVFDLEKSKGRVVVLDFWASWCGPCLKALPEVIEALRIFPPDRVELISVNQGQSEQDVAEFLQTRQWKLKTALDFDQKSGMRFGVRGIPHTVVIAPDGKVAWVKSGYSPGGAAELAKKVKELLK